MTDADQYIYLAHVSGASDFCKEPVLLLCDGYGNFSDCSIDRLSGEKRTIVTHSFAVLVDWFRSRGLPLPSRVVDIETACKLVVGRPKSDFAAERPWEMATLLSSADEAIKSDEPLLRAIRANAAMGSVGEGDMRQQLRLCASALARM